MRQTKMYPLRYSLGGLKALVFGSHSVCMLINRPGSQQLFVRGYFLRTPRNSAFNRVTVDCDHDTID